MLSTLAGDIHDSRFLRLLRNMLQAGYLDDWVWHATLSGAPQGGVASPILSNIYLHRLDSYVENVLIPEYTRGTGRAPNPDYQEVEKQLVRARRRGDRPAVRALRKQRRSLPSKDPNDPGFRRLRYVRYCDDHLLGFTGPKAEAEEIKIRLAAFLREELKLELSQEKTLITHARTGAARFLGYEITVQHADHKVTGKGRSINGTVGLRVPRDVIKAKCGPYLKLGKPERRNQMVNEDDHTIVRTYGAQYRGLVEYYLLAGDVYRLNRLEWVMKTSMLKTLACKHDSTVTKMADRYKTTITTPSGPRRCFEVSVEREGRKPLVARFGGIPLRRKTERGPDRPRTTPGQRPAKRAGHPAPSRTVRAVQASGRHGGSPPRPQARRPRQTRATAARMGPAHGQEAQEDAHRLRRLPCSHPWRATNRDSHAVVTGEPDARKASPSGSGGGRRVGSSPAGTTPDGLPRWSAPTRTAGRSGSPPGSRTRSNVHDFIDPAWARPSLRRLRPRREHRLGQRGHRPRHRRRSPSRRSAAGGTPSAARLPRRVPAADHRRRRRLQRLPHPAVEDRTRRAGRRDRPADHRLPPATRHLEVEQDRAPAVLPISMNWRGRPLTSHDVIVETIAATTTSTGLSVHAELDTSTYPNGIKIPDKEMKALEATHLQRHTFHGNWNYTVTGTPADNTTHPNRQE